MIFEHLYLQAIKKSVNFNVQPVPNNNLEKINSKRGLDDTIFNVLERAV
ncbi:hypothetical protein [Okeania sp.]|nr:hypothetical protein [Okeania sp.]MEB3340545.1 hypothetical protein [Okeania sp.]